MTGQVLRGKTAKRCNDYDGTQLYSENEDKIMKFLKKKKDSTP